MSLMNLFVRARPEMDLRGDAAPDSEVAHWLRTAQPDAHDNQADRGIWLATALGQAYALVAHLERKVFVVPEHFFPLGATAGWWSVLHTWAAHYKDVILVVCSLQSNKGKQSSITKQVVIGQQEWHRNATSILQLAANSTQMRDRAASSPTIGMTYYALPALALTDAESQQQRVMSFLGQLPHAAVRPPAGQGAEEEALFQRRLAWQPLSRSGGN